VRERESSVWVSIVSERKLGLKRKWCMEHCAPMRTNSHSLTVPLTSTSVVNMPRAFTSTLALCSFLTFPTSISPPPPSNPLSSASAIPASFPSPRAAQAETVLVGAGAPTVRIPVALVVRISAAAAAAMEEKSGPCCHGKQISACNLMYHVSFVFV